MNLWPVPEENITGPPKVLLRNNDSVTCDMV